MNPSAQRGPGQAERDLRWYFNRSDTGPLKSNFGAMAYRLALGRARSDVPAGVVDDEALESAARSGSIARVLRALDPETADVLWRAFGAEVPVGVESYGDLAGLAPLTRSAKEAFQRAEVVMDFSTWLERLPFRCSNQAAMQILVDISKEAAALRRRAVASYLNMRRKVGAYGGAHETPGVLHDYGAERAHGYQPEEGPPAHRACADQQHAGGQPALCVRLGHRAQAPRALVR